MGRAKYSPEMRNSIMAAFVAATRSIIDKEGIQAASIRRVSTAAGFSSATLYLYFVDMNELITMSLISYLGDYVNDVIESTVEGEDFESEYRRTWTLFCKHAFANPTLFHNLFFGPQSGNLDIIAQKYYELFPEELERATGRMLEMLGRGSLRERNLVVLETYAADLGLSEHEVHIANDMTVAYFRSFLRVMGEAEHTEAECAKAVDQFIEGAFFVLRGASE